MSLTMEAVTAALREREAQSDMPPNPMVSLAIFGEGSGIIAVANAQLGGGPAVDLLVFETLDQLEEWVDATPAKRAEIEHRERAGREEREARDFAKLDLLCASASGGVQ